MKCFSVENLENDVVKYFWTTCVSYCVIVLYSQFTVCIVSTSSRMSVVMCVVLFLSSCSIAAVLKLYLHVQAQFVYLYVKATGLRGSG